MSHQLAGEARRPERMGSWAVGNPPGYFGCRPPQTWAPNVNAYELTHSYEVCVDLAGVHKNLIDIEVVDRRLRLSGRRSIAFPDSIAAADVLRVHLMEIDDGQFAREVELPPDVDSSRISAQQHNGLLWISMPRVSPGPTA